MRITILANRDLPACMALNQLIPALLPDHELSLFLSAWVGKAGDKPAPLAELAFFEQTLFNDLLFPLTDRDGGSGQGELASFQQLARRTGRPLKILNAINRGEDLAAFKASAPDLVLSIRYGVILREPVLSQPRYGVLNLHSGKLPEYKGVMATFWALLAGEQEIGTTVHSIDDEGVDTGRIIATTRMAVDPSRSYLWHVLGLYRDGCEELLRCVQKLDRGQPLAGSPQPEAGCYFTFPGPAELEAFQHKGFRLLEAEHVASVARRFLPRT